MVYTSYPQQCIIGFFYAVYRVSFYYVVFSDESGVEYFFSHCSKLKVNQINLIEFEFNFSPLVNIFLHEYPLYFV